MTPILAYLCMEIAGRFKTEMASSPKTENSPNKTEIGDPPPPARPATVLEQPPGEVGGPKGPEPTRYGDWAFKGIVSDF